MKKFWKSLSALAGFGTLFAFLSLLFVASIGGFPDGRKIPLAWSVLNNRSCYVPGCHYASGSTLNEAGSVSFNNLPERFVPGETYDLGITITGGTTYGFQMASVYSDGTQAGALTAVTEDTTVVDKAGPQILTHTSNLESGMVDFQWTAPMEPKEKSVTFRVASNSADGDGRPTGDAINTLTASIPTDSEIDVPMPVELTERLHFAQFANGTGIVSQISLLNVDVGEDVYAKLELRGGDGAPLNVALNGEMISGETGVFTIAAGGGAVYASDGQGPVVAGSLTVHSDGPLSGVVLFEGATLGVAGVGNSEPLAGFRAPAENRSGDKLIRTGVAVMNLDAEEKTLQAKLIGLDGTEVGTGTVTTDPLAGNGHMARFIDEFNWDDPVPDLTDFQGVLEVVPSHGRVAATVLRISSGNNMASLPVAAMQ
ncbi:MAG: hypothetical protein OXH11_21410 [Candidatus Aminicenantes bacterium]|nr:hypothetical protein [Candidatus Aminicenantes bacterium]